MFERRHGLRKAALILTIGIASMSAINPHRGTWLAMRSVKPLSVALIFYGLTRSLSNTAPTIHANIYSILRAHNIDFDVHMHTVQFWGEYSNPRNGEIGVSLNNSEWKLLHPDYISHTNHTVFLSLHRELINRVLSHGDPHANGGLSTRNELEALHSMKIAASGATTTGKKYDGMLILRPDLNYVDPVDLALFIWAVKHDAIVTPEWQQWAGENDRFSFGSWRGMLEISTRFDRVLDFCKQTGSAWHAEKFLSWEIRRILKAKQASLHCRTNQKADRVRANGNEHNEDFRDHASDITQSCMKTVT